MQSFELPAVSENVSTPESEKMFKKECDVCYEVFFQNSDFEKQMEEKHKVKKTNKCSIGVKFSY